MPRYRLSDPAKADVAALLRGNEKMHGAEARVHHRALLAAALRRIAAQPHGLSSATTRRNTPRYFAGADTATSP
jgi:toxin ParE1/3/4